MPSVEPDIRLNLTTLRLRPEPKSRVGQLTDGTTQASFDFYLLTLFQIHLFSLNPYCYLTMQTVIVFHQNHLNSFLSALPASQPLFKLQPADLPKIRIRELQIWSLAGNLPFGPHWPPDFFRCLCDLLPSPVTGLLTPYQAPSAPAPAPLSYFQFL